MNNPNPTNYTNQNLLFFYKKPWALYTAEDWNTTTATIPDSSGNNRGNMTTSGGSFQKLVQSGNGSIAPIHFISASTQARQCLFPVGSIPTNFTIAALTMYVPGSLPFVRNVIMTSSTINAWILGHWNSTNTTPNGRGRVYLGSVWNTDDQSIMINVNNTEWQTTIATNGGVTPHNVLIDGKARGIATGGIGNGRLGMNNSPNETASTFRFSAVVIFDSVLSVPEMYELNSYFKTYLDKGTSLKSYLNNVPLSSIYNSINYPIINNPLNVYTANSFLLKKNKDNIMTNALQVNGFLNVNNQPRWHGYVAGASGTTTIGNITYDANRFTAVNVNFNLSNGFVIIQVAGRYVITFNAIGISGAGAFVEVRLYKNLKTITRNYSERYASNNIKGGMNLYAILDLLEGDVININANTGGVPLSVSNSSYFVGYMIY